VIAAANPSGGHYDKGKTIVENLKLNTALLSRFDLIFLMLDQLSDAQLPASSPHCTQGRAASSLSAGLLQARHVAG